MRGAPAWQGRRSVQHPSSVSALRADPPSPTRGEGESATLTRRPSPSRTSSPHRHSASSGR
ncbi:MAG: hypothetical protein EOQ32_16990 [Mesorhizobium sp.]|nr:MAG: hypothetical protein EOQ32_16990 [Mesorhizobium sp.]